MSPLPPLFQAFDSQRVQFAKSDGLVNQARLAEPGQWFDLARNDLTTVNLPAVTSITDVLLTGADPSTGEWLITVTPITTQSGSAAADGMPSATVSVTAAATTLTNVMLAAIISVGTSATLTLPAHLANWKRFRSYVTAIVSPVGATTLRLTSVSSGMSFSVEVVAPAGNGSTINIIASQTSATAKVGTYMAIDRAKGTNGFSPLGIPYVTQITSSTPGADIVGPVYLSNGTEPLVSGYSFREFKTGKDFSVARYGHMLAYGEGAVAAIDGPVYARHTVSGDYITGLATDAAGAALNATTGLSTVTPVGANLTVYQMTVTAGGVLIGTLDYTSDASGTADEIADGYRADLAVKPAILAVMTADAGPNSPVVFTSTDPTGSTLVLADTGVGDSGIVNTPAISTHTLLTRGDKFLAPSTRIGAVPVDVPHSNA